MCVGLLILFTCIIAQTQTIGIVCSIWVRFIDTRFYCCCCYEGIVTIPYRILIVLAYVYTLQQRISIVVIILGYSLKMNRLNIRIQQAKQMCAWDDAYRLHASIIAQTQNHGDRDKKVSRRITITARGGRVKQERKQYIWSRLGRWQSRRGRHKEEKKAGYEGSQAQVAAGRPIICGWVCVERVCVECVGW